MALPARRCARASARLRRTPWAKTGVSVVKAGSRTTVVQVAMTRRRGMAPYCSRTCLIWRASKSFRSYSGFAKVTRRHSGREAILSNPAKSGSMLNFGGQHRVLGRELVASVLTSCSRPPIRVGRLSEVCLRMISACQSVVRQTPRSLPVSEELVGWADYQRFTRLFWCEAELGSIQRLPSTSIVPLFGLWGRR